MELENIKIDPRKYRGSNCEMVVGPLFIIYNNFCNINCITNRPKIWINNSHNEVVEFMRSEGCLVWILHFMCCHISHCIVKSKYRIFFFVESWIF